MKILGTVVGEDCYFRRRERKRRDVMQIARKIRKLQACLNVSGTCRTGLFDDQTSHEDSPQSSVSAGSQARSNLSQSSNSLRIRRKRSKVGMLIIEGGLTLPLLVEYWSCVLMSSIPHV